MIEAVLLDLDNTMVLFDETAYVERYFDRLYPWFSDLYTPEELKGRTLAATVALRKNTGLVSNREFFLDRFDPGGNGSRSGLWRRFMKFYETDYAGIRLPVSAPEGLQEVLSGLARSRFKVVLASNPVFPRIAQETRMGWAGIAPNHFDLFTHIENMSFVKPNAGYYHQVCDMLRVRPGACLMVGNDPVADMTARQAGLKTYLTTDAVEAGFASMSLTVETLRTEAGADVADFVGPFSGVPEAVGKLGGSVSETALRQPSDPVRSGPSLNSVQRRCF